MKDRPGRALNFLLASLGSLGGSDRSFGTVMRFQRMPAPLSVRLMAVKTWVPSGLSGSSIASGMSNSGTLPRRTKIFISLRLTNTAT